MWYGIYKNTEGNHYEELYHFWSCKQGLRDKADSVARTYHLPRGWYYIASHYGDMEKTGIIKFFFRGELYNKQIIEVGDTVRIVRNTCFHGYDIGSIHIIKAITGENYNRAYHIVGGASFVRRDDVVLLNQYPTEEDLGLT